MSLRKKCLLLPDDIFSIILSFLGKETYFNKFTEEMHVRFIKGNQFSKLTVLFMEVNYKYKNVFNFKDCFEISLNTPQVLRKHSACEIFCNRFKLSEGNDGYPSDMLIGLDTNKYFIMQLIDTIFCKTNGNGDCEHLSTIYQKYTCFPVEKKVVSVDPLIEENPFRFLYL
jgi:hypothetical protein